MNCICLDKLIEEKKMIKTSKRFSLTISSTPSNFAYSCRRNSILTTNLSSCCYVNIKKAAIFVGLIDLLGQCGQFYKNIELYFLLFNCR